MYLLPQNGFVFTVFTRRVHVNGPHSWPHTNGKFSESSKFTSHAQDLTWRNHDFTGSFGREFVRGFCYFRMTSLYQERVWVLFYSVLHVPSQCFYRSSEWTKQTLTLDTDFHIFSKFHVHCRFSYRTGTKREDVVLEICKLTTRCHLKIWQKLQTHNNHF